MIQDQEKILQDAKKTAKQQAYFMRKALQNADLRKGLKFSSQMLGQLKKSSLAPRNYYILFMTIFDYMRELQNYFRDDFRRGRKMIDVYEAVQHAPGLIPRLYLLITVGSVYIQSHEQGSEKILDDLIEMMKAVQNPLRGLFLRYYFLKMCKDRLPDTGSQYQTQTRGVKEAIEIIHINLTESTNLWMRIGGGRDKARRQKEKEDLKILIGQNLMRISSLDGVNIKIYKEFVLPKMLILLKQSKDSMTQQYLLDCMIQGFPEQFHINTLPELLGTCSKQLQKQVDMKLIFITLMQRLSNYLTDSSTGFTVNQELNIYDLFKQNIKELVKNSVNTQVKNTLNLYSAFLQFTLKCYPSQHSYVNQILKDASYFCQHNEMNIDQDCQIYISKFLIHPLDTLAHVILTMDQYPNLMKYLKFKRRREVAKQIVKAVGKGSIDLTDTKVVTQLLTFINPVLKRQKDYQNISQSMFKDQQTLVAKIVWQIKSQDPGTVWQVLKIFIDKFLQGGQDRMKFTLPSSIFKLLNLASDIFRADPSCDPKAFKKIFDLSRKLIQKLSVIHPVLAIKASLQLILTINNVDEGKYFDQFTYETSSQCLLLYESQISDSFQKQKLLQAIINSCLRLHCLSDENYDIVLSNITSYCSKILKKNEQCQILLSCCFLFTNPQADSNRIHEILKRCAKLANTSVNQSINHLGLFFLILDSYIYFVKQKQIIEDKDQAIPQIIEMIQAKLIQEQEGQQQKKVLIEHKNKWNQIKVKYQ